MCGLCSHRNGVRSSFLLGLLLLFPNPLACRAGDSQREVSGPYCGLYCVYAALQSIGQDVPFERLLSPRYLSSRQGSSIEELRQAAIDCGAYAVAMTGLGAESLRSARQAMILHVSADGNLKRYNHWALFCGLENGKVRLLDAPNAIQLEPLSSVLARWDGVALLVSDDSSVSRSVEMAERVFHVSLILLILITVYLAHVAVQRISTAQSIGHARSVQSLAVRAPVQSAVLLGCALVLGIVLHLVDDAGFIRNLAAVRYVAAANISHFFPKLTHDEARRFVLTRRGRIVDARLPESFHQGAIPGSINVPVNASAAERRAKLGPIPRNTPLLVYCQSNRCEFDETLAALLSRDGFESISLYPGGWMEWEKYEHPEQASR